MKMNLNQYADCVGPGQTAHVRSLARAFFTEYYMTESTCSKRAGVPAGLDLYGS